MPQSQQQKNYVWRKVENSLWLDSSNIGATRSLKDGRETDNEFGVHLAHGQSRLVVFMVLKWRNSAAFPSIYAIIDKQREARSKHDCAKLRRVTFL